MARDELAGGEVEDLGLVELGIEAEVEALEGLGGIEGGAAQPQAELALGAALDFVLQEHGEEVDEGGLLLDGLAIADVERLEDAGQAQGAEHRGELMGQFHRGTSCLPLRGRGRRWSRGARGAAAGGRRGGDGREAGQRLLIEGVGQDGLDGVVAILADGVGAGAGGVEARGAVALGEAEHALGAAQAIERAIAEQGLDEQGTGGADLGGAAPDTRRASAGGSGLCRAAGGR